MTDIQHIKRFIRRRSFALIGSVNDSGYPNIKAMLKPRRICGSSYWFSTNTSSLRVQQYLKNDKGCIYFFRKGLFRYEGVMLTGHFEVMTDSETKKTFWRRGDTIFYNKGVNDPDYCILKFTAQKCRYYCDLKTEDIDIGGVSSD